MSAHHLLLASGRANEAQRMARDHQIFIGRDHPRGRSATGLGQAWAAGLVRALVDVQAKPCRLSADPAANLRRVFADAGGKHQRMLRSNDLIWSMIVHSYLMGERQPMIDLMAWNADATHRKYNALPS
jgi:hypothetical protein